MASTSKRCKATNRRGEPCAAYACKDSDYCYWHDPDKAAERKAARRKGGLARHGRSIGVTGDPEPVAISSVADVVRLLEQAVNDVLRLENSIQRARAIGYLAGVIVKALELGELEERVAALEAALKANQRGGGGGVNKAAT